MACFALQLLGFICARTERLLRAAEAFKRSLKLNPFLWQSFVALCDQGDKSDPSKVFRLDSLETFSNCHGSTVLTLVNSANPVSNVGVNSDSGVINNTLNSVSVNSSDTVQQTPTLIPIQNTPNNLLPVVNTPAQNFSNVSTPVSLISLNTPVAVTLTPSMDRGVGEFGDGVIQAPKKKRILRIRSIMGGPMSLSPLTPSFGILPLEVTSPACDSEHSSLNSSVAFLTPSPLSLSQLDSEPNTKVPPPISKRVSLQDFDVTVIVLTEGRGGIGQIFVLV